MLDYDKQSRQKVQEGHASVLDWFHSLLRLKPIPIPDDDRISSESFDKDSSVSTTEVPLLKPASSGIALTWPAFLFPVGVLLALVAQLGFENAQGDSVPSIILMILSLIFVVWSFRNYEYKSPEKFPAAMGADAVQVNLPMFTAGILLSVLTYLLSGRNLFTLPTVVSWVGSISLTSLAFWPEKIQPLGWIGQIRRWISSPEITIRLKRGSLILLCIFAVSFFYRFYRLGSVPVDMWSDQAEKLLDVADVLAGRYSIFFLRNSGREAIQFYLSALIAGTFGTGVSFLTLKIGTAFLGFITLPFLYLLVKEFDGKKAALFALFLGGIAYWPNLISRAGLRFPLYPLFTAPALYFLLRGLRARRMQSFVLLGLTVGFGLHGYSPARIIPLAVAVGVLLFLVHPVSRGWRKQAAAYLIVSGLIALIVLMPLLRVAVEIPDIFLFRTISRLGEVERSFPGNPWMILVANMWDALKMFNVDHGEIWILAPTHRPAFDWVTASFFLIGMVFTMIRYLRSRTWIDIYMVFSIPVLLLPSVLALAFPAENPALNRASGAMLPALAFAGIGFARLSDWSIATLKEKHHYQWIPITLLLLSSALVNFNMVFNVYDSWIEKRVWNTADAARVLRGFAESTGHFDTGYVVAYPHWMDTRLVGIHTGHPGRDTAIWPDELDRVANETRSQLFIVNPSDNVGLSRLQELFPEGRISLWDSPVEGHDFLIYSVP